MKNNFNFATLPIYKSKGIGKELIPYYEKQGMSKATGALIRNYDNQSGCEA